MDFNDSNKKFNIIKLIFSLIIILVLFFAIQLGPRYVRVKKQFNYFTAANQILYIELRTNIKGRIQKGIIISDEIIYDELSNTILQSTESWEKSARIYDYQLGFKAFLKDGSNCYIKFFFDEEDEKINISFSDNERSTLITMLYIDINRFWKKIADDLELEIIQNKGK